MIHVMQKKSKSTEKGGRGGRKGGVRGWIFESTATLSALKMDDCVLWWSNSAEMACGTNNECERDGERKACR